MDRVIGHVDVGVWHYKENINTKICIGCMRERAHRNPHAYATAFNIEQY